MKKAIAMFVVIIMVYILIGNIATTESIIPREAIRIRVIANSNSEYDQNIKYKVKDILENKFYNLLKNSKNVEDARKIIKENLNMIENDIDILLYNENYLPPFTINYGLNYFPKKIFKGVTYNEGYYESIVVELGDGLGDNWWCVLFPPLCLIEADESTEVEYTTVVKSIVDKYF